MKNGSNWVDNLPSVPQVIVNMLVSFIVAAIVVAWMRPNEPAYPFLVSSSKALAEKLGKGATEDEVAEAYQEMYEIYRRLAGEGIVVLNDAMVMRAPATLYVPFTPRVREIIADVEERAEE